MPLYLHIGVGKTGTTSLQHFFADFKSQIEQQGFYFLRTGANETGVEHHPLASLLGFGVQGDLTLSPAALLAAIQSEVRHQRDKNILISSENFHSHISENKLATLQQALAGVEVKVVLYMRRQDAWIDSAFRQFVEMGSVRSIEETIQAITTSQVIDYSHQWNVWGNAFGASNVILRIYEPKYMLGDTVTDFSKIIGLQLSDAMSCSKYEANPSLQPLEAEVLRLVNKISRQRTPGRARMLETLRADKTIVHDKFHFMSPSQRRFILSYFAGSNERVARDYFSRSDGILFRDPPDDRLFQIEVISFS